jgi:hypothetical protein
MLGFIPIARMVAGSILMVVGLVAIPLPVFPGIPIVFFGAALGFGWHPKGLRVLRRCKVKIGRIFRKRGPEAQRLG